MKANLLLLLALALLLAQCKKREPDPSPPADPLAALPAETQTGAGTFGCLVNGKPYYAPSSLYANGDWMSLNTLSINGQLYDNGIYTNSWYPISLVMNGSLQGANSTVFNLIARTQPQTIFTPGTNQFFTSTTSPNNIYYSGQYVKTGQVTLTKFDGVARIASGRFAFTLYELGKADTLKVTSGRFDVKF